MFIEPQRNIKTGWIEVICGSMFSGKTEELIRRLKRAIIAKQKVEIFKPSIDTRYDENDVVSHNSNSIASTPVTNAQSILLLSNDIDVVGIDEAQFFDDQLPQVCQVLANKGIRVIIAGLDMDFKGQPFGTMPGIASHSFRLINEDATVLLGEKESYEPRCRKCFNEGIREEMFND